MKKFIVVSLTSIALMLSTTITVQAINKWYSTSIVGTKKDQKLSFVSGIVRQKSDGNWYVQNDSDHSPLNIHSVEVKDNKVRFFYGSTFKKVVSLVITPDDALAEKGYVVSGASVGTQAADFRIGRMLNLYGGVSFNKSTKKWDLSYQNSEEYSLKIEQRPNGVLRVWHPQDDFGLIPTQLTARSGGYSPQLHLFDSHYFDVRFYDHSGKLVTKFDEKCSFLFNRSGYRIVDVSKEKFPEGGNFWVMGIMDL